MNVGRVHSFEATCVVDVDPGEVVRRARPLTAEDAGRLREQMIARLAAEARRPSPVARSPHAVEERVRLAMRGLRPGVRHDSETGLA